MYKIFKVTYNDGEYHTGHLPFFYYIAEDKEYIVTHSKKYQDFFKKKKFYGGDIWIYEVCEFMDRYEFENFSEFDVHISITKKA